MDNTELRYNRTRSAAGKAVTERLHGKTIPLTREQYLELERALQWPEDLATYDRINTPTNFAKILGNLAAI